MAWAADNASKAVTGFKAMSSAMQSTSLAAGGVAAAAVAGFLVWDRWRNKQKEISERTAEVAAALRDQITETFRLAEASIDATGEIDGLQPQQALNDSLTEGDNGEKAIQALGELGRQADELREILIDSKDDPIAALQHLGGQAGFTAEEAAYLADVVNSTDDAWFAAADSGGFFTDAMRRAGVAMEELQDQAEKHDLDALVLSELNAAAANNPGLRR